MNGASCFDLSDGSGYACACSNGFEGTNCENGKPFKIKSLNLVKYSHSIVSLIPHRKKRFYISEIPINFMFFFIYRKIDTKIVLTHYLTCNPTFQLPFQKSLPVPAVLV